MVNGLLGCCWLLRFGPVDGCLLLVAWVAGVGVGDSGVVSWRLLEYRIVVGRRRGCGGFWRSVWGSFVVWFGADEKKNN